METKLGHKFFFHSIVAEGPPSCAGTSTGTTYLTLSDRTKGEKLSLCAADWSVLFKKLESAVIESAPLPCDFEIPETPAGQEGRSQSGRRRLHAHGWQEEQLPQGHGRERMRRQDRLVLRRQQRAHAHRVLPHCLRDGKGRRQARHRLRLRSPVLL